jgi:hypothetical protein
MGLALAVLLSLSLALVSPQLALAYYDRGPVGITLGAGTVSVKSGSSVSVSVAISPASDEQTQGCGMAECPQTCPAECTDARGQCICAGSGYSTYYPEVSASSSNNGVATVSYAGGAVQINGVKAGSATVTVTASLRQFSTSSASIAVTVSESASGAGGAGDPSAAGGGGAGPKSSSKTTTTTTTTTDGGATGVTVSPTDLARAAAEGQESQDAAGEKVVEMHGVTARLVPLSTGKETVAKLKEIAGTTEQVTFWQGGTVERPDYSWTFYGEDFNAAALATLDALDALDLTIHVSEKGSGLVAGLLANADKTLVLNFASEGALPVPATLYIAAPAELSATDALQLYRYDEEAACFRFALGGLGVESGYIAFETDEYATWAISAEDLAAIPAAQAPTAAASQKNAGPVGGFVSLLVEHPLLSLLGAFVLLGVVVMLITMTRFAKLHQKERVETEVPKDGE